MRELLSFKVAIVIFSFLFTGFSYADWGSQGVNTTKRTTQDWESGFSSIPDVVVDQNSSNYSNITSAINYCNSLSANQYCYIKVNPGTYQENISDTEIYINRSNIKISGTRTGSSLEFSDWETVLESDQPSFIYIAGGLENIVIENLHLKGSFTNYDVTGISLYDENVTNMSIRFNKISDFTVDVNSDPFSAGAAGIDISGTGGIGSEISNVLIENNYITDMTNGYSENISVGGNIKAWDILNNYIHTVTNIGIDAIGGENNSSTHSVNAARDGLIKGNTVKNLIEASANIDGVAAIYVDGGRNIHIEDNYVDVTSHGYTIGAENCIDTTNITLINNTSKNAVFEDLTVGGYSLQGYTYGVDIECDGNGGGHGSVSQITVGNNTFDSPNASPLNSNDSNFPVQMNYRVTAAVIDQDGIVEVNESGDGSAPSGQNAVRKTFPNNNNSTPELISIDDGDTLSGSSTTFTWTSNGYNVSTYWLDIGSFSGGDDIKSKSFSSSVTSHTYDGLPTDGSTLYVRLYYNDDYDFEEYTINADVIPELTSHSDGDTLSGSSQSFAWVSNGYNVSTYWLDIGSYPGGDDIKSKSFNPSITSHTYDGLPTDGSTLYVRLYYNDDYDFVSYELNAFEN